MIEKTSIRVGSMVSYQPKHYVEIHQWENGIVKEMRDSIPDQVWVVYNCDGDWKNFHEYTGALTNLADLTLGWNSNGC